MPKASFWALGRGVHPGTLASGSSSPLVEGDAGFLPISGPIYGLSMLAGGIIVAIMILLIGDFRVFMRRIPRRPISQARGSRTPRRIHWEVIRIA